MTNLKDVAQLAGVSVMTVSRVVNKNGYVKEETRNRVYRAIEKLNYYPNNLGRSLNRNKSNIIAVLSPLAGGAMESDPYFTRLLYGIEMVLVDYSYDLLLSTQRKKQVNGEYQFDYFRLFMERKADALILMGAQLTTKDIITIEKNNIPFCVIGDRPNVSFIDIVDTENYAGFRVMLEKVYALGHRKIGFGGLDSANFNIHERYLSYCEFLKDKNITFNQDYIFEYPNQIDQGRNIIKEYSLLKDKPSVIVFSTDNYAIDAVVEAKRSGIRIPEDLAISGFDGSPIGQHIEPKLDTMDQPLEEMGMKAGELLIKRLQNPKKACESVFFDVSFHAGNSLGSPIPLS